MAAGSVARRYARALFDLAQEQGVVEKVGSELAQVVQTLREQTNLRGLWESQDVPATVKLAFIQEQFGDLSELLRNFLSVLVNKRRETHLPQIYTEYQAMADEAAGRVTVEVRTATPLHESMAGALQARLAAALNKQVKMESRVDPALMGGIIVRVGDLQMDGSVRTRLKRMRERLITAQGV